MIITAVQLKAARRLLGWSQSELAGQIGVSKTTISYMENDYPRRSIASRIAIRAALEDAGVEFTNGGEAGVKLRGKG
jgi:transcriptional regulator with XRE-family HTH domain